MVKQRFQHDALRSVVRVKYGSRDPYVPYSFHQSTELYGTVRWR
jgi:hypothetical protein